MKGFFFILLIGLSMTCYGQIITVNDAADPESSYDLKQLIVDVLLSSNCATVNTFSSQVKGSPNDRQTKSYGYFKRPSGSSFPFENGVILTTGRAYGAGNNIVTPIVTPDKGNAYPDYDNGLNGDSDLEDALGVTTTFDATYIKFNFTPLGNNISFRFLMASEEYNEETECIYSDGFAFLLREVGTTTYQNLAVLPNGDTVSTTNINNAAVCRSNSEFLEGYGLTDTNYGGRTKILKASASVVPNTTYEIKIVVADQNDGEWDSAIFLESASFNVLGDLGPDRTVALGNPGCDGETITLDASLSVPVTSYKWFKNGSEISGAVSATYNVTTSGIYRVEIDMASGCSSYAEVEIEFTTPPIISTMPEDLLICESDNDFQEEFDFSGNQALVLGSQVAADFPVSFHNSQADSETNNKPIPLPNAYLNQTMPGETIWVRIADKTQTCYKVSSFNIEVKQKPLLNNIQDYELCSNTNSTIFDLTTKDSEVIGTQTKPLLVTYHLTPQDAIDNIPIANSTSYSNISTPQQIFVRSQFDDNGNGIADPEECFNTDMSFNLIVNRNPTLISPDPIKICNDVIVTNYNLTIRESQITGGDSSISLLYFESQTDLDNNNPIPDATAYTNTVLDKNILVLATDAKGCSSKTTLSLKTIIYTNLNLNPSSINECEVDNDGYDFFNLTLREAEILNGLDASDFTFTYYENEDDAYFENPNNIKVEQNYLNTQPNIQTIYVRVLSKPKGCFFVVPIQLEVTSVSGINLDKEYVICLDSNNNVIAPENTTFLRTPPIDTGLRTNEYTFKWYNATEDEVNANPMDNIIQGATDAQYEPTVTGNYTVEATSKATGCRIMATTVVLGSYPPERISVELLSDIFSTNNTIKVSVIGNGDYEYRLDFGSWQGSNVFEDLTGGEHTVYVRDILNCNMISEIQVIVDYPRYFTPNGDGTHDTWNIIEIDSLPNPEIYIFDRYGKLLKQLKPSSQGWDGTYRGELLPTGDYWFVIEYVDPFDNIKREFRSHFTLKR